MKQVIIILLLFLIGCIPEPEQFLSKYTIQNESEVTVQISFYKEGRLNSFGGTTSLGVSERFEGLNVRRGVPRSSLSQSQVEHWPKSSFRSSDSILIVFDNRKRLNYTIIGTSEFSEPLNRNIFRDSNYESIGNDEFLYKVTQADFENAEDCDGDCN